MLLCEVIQDKGFLLTNDKFSMFKGPSADSPGKIWLSAHGSVPVTLARLMLMR